MANWLNNTHYNVVHAFHTMRAPEAQLAPDSRKARQDRSWMFDSRPSK